jgi:type IV pilus assembly protein PilF
MSALRPWRAWAILLLASLWLSACVSPAPPVLEQLTRPEPDSTRQRAARRLQLATAYYEQSQDEVAQQEVRAALQIDPNYAEAYSLLGLIHQRQNAPDLAARSFEQALRLAVGPQASPADLGAVQHNYGWFLCQQGRLAEGQTQLARALSQPGYGGVAKTWMVLGQCQKMAGQTLQARNSWLQALSRDPQNRWVRERLAELDAAEAPTPRQAAPASKSEPR